MYDPSNKIWKIPLELKDKVVDAVGNECVENGIRIFDVPDFVH